MKTNKGFIGLIGLLIGFAIIALLLWRTDLFQSKTKDGVPQKTIIEQDLEVVQSAKDAKAILEIQSKVRVEGLNENN
jgi:hypothetical protein